MTANPPSSETIQVQLFASYADRLGRNVIEIPARGIRTAGDLLARLRLLPSGAAIGPSTLIAINHRHATLETPVRASDEVAVMPPLSGG